VAGLELEGLEARSMVVGAPELAVLALAYPGSEADSALVVREPNPVLAGRTG